MGAYMGAYTPGYMLQGETGTDRPYSQGYSSIITISVYGQVLIYGPVNWGTIKLPSLSNIAQVGWFWWTDWHTHNLVVGFCQPQERLCSEDLDHAPTTHYQTTQCRHVGDIHDCPWSLPLWQNPCSPALGLISSVDTMQLKIAKDYSRTEVRQAFFSNHVVNEWNRLDETVVNGTDFEMFQITTWAV